MNSGSKEGIVIVGAAGQTGEYFTRHLQKVRPVSGVVREKRWADESKSGINFYPNFADSIKNEEPTTIILATPNPTKRILEEMSPYIPDGSVLVLPQNGVDVPGQALSLIRPEISLVRSSLFSSVYWDENGQIAFDPDKERIAFAAISRAPGKPTKQDEWALRMAQLPFVDAGFDVVQARNYNNMQWTKLVANEFGATGEVTGEATFRDNEIFNLEWRALKTRLDILKAAGINFGEDIPWVNSLKLLAMIPDAPSILRGTFAKRFLPKVYSFGVKINTKLREHTAEQFAAARNYQPSAAARAIFTEDPEQTAHIVEPTDYYHQPMVDLAREHGKRSPLDEALIELLDLHKLNTGPRKISPNLAERSAEERRDLLLETANLEEMPIYVKRNELAHQIVRGLFFYGAKDFSHRVFGDLDEVSETLEAGGSIIVAPNHDSHSNHPAVSEGLKKLLGRRRFSRYPFTGVANVFFNQSFLTSMLFEAYPHVRVWTVTKDSSPDERYKAKIVNQRTIRELDKLLYPPDGVKERPIPGSTETEKVPSRPQILLLYMEGSRSPDGLRKPKPGATLYFHRPEFKLIVPTAMTGTREILPPEQKGERGKTQMVSRTDNFSITFGTPIKTTELLKEARDEAGRKGEEEYMGDYVMRRIAAMLPEEQRGEYA